VLYGLNQGAPPVHKGAMVSLAHIHRDGLLGVKPDAGEAAMWKRRAYQAPR
jgi:TPR repeat protein